MADNRSLPLPASTDVVTTLVTVNGERLPAAVHLLSVSVDMEVNRIPAATLVFSDGDAGDGGFDLSGQDLFVPGAEVEIQLGYGAVEEPVFSGLIVKQALRLNASGTTLSVDCRDPAIKMTLTRRCHYFTEVSDSDIADELVNAHGLNGDVTGLDITHEKVVQFDATDWDFLISRLEANGHICLIQDGTLVTGPPDMDQDADLTLTFGATMLAFDAEIDARSQPTGIVGVSWDPAAQEVVEGEAQDPGLAENGNLASTDVADALGSNRRLQHSGRRGANEMQAWVDGRLLRERLAKVRGRVSFQGVASVQPGQVINLEGVGPRFTGPVYVSGVRHRVSAGAWVTDVQFGLCAQPIIATHDVNSIAAGALLPAVQGLQIGLVTNLEQDPAGEHRIQVRLPIIDPQAEGVWARLCTLDAGDTRGSFFLPEIEDEVLVGFLNDDPRDAVVLGMLHSSAKPAPFEASNDNHEKGFVSREGMQVRFHEEEKSITISTPAGKQLVLSEDAASVQLDDENGNQILLNGDGITVSAEGDLNITATGDVNISGANTTLEADQAFAASGSSGAELTSDGSVTVKGATVMIN